MSLSDELQQQLSGFKQQQQPNTGVTGVLVPVKIQRPGGGSVRIYLSLSPETVSSAAALAAALDEINERFDLDVWKPSSGSGSGFKSGGGWRR